MKWTSGSFLALGLLLVVTGMAAAGPIAVDETPLNPSGEAYELHNDGAGVLWASDYGGEIRRIDPALGSYVAYPVASPLDAQPDAAGRVWFTDGAERFGYLDPTGGQVTTWTGDGAGDVSLWGVAIDDAGRVWLTEWFGTASSLRRFDPDSWELCTYVLPGGVASYYILYHEGALWLANWGNDRIYRFVPATGQTTWWQLPAGGSSAQGLALDGDGRLWFADADAKALRRFDPSGNQLTSYAVPTSSAPQMVAVIGKLVWYTGKTPATVGVLNPAAASGSVATLTPSSAAVTPACTTLGPGTVTPAAGVSDTLAWSSGSWAESVAGDGWTVYALPDGGLPWGIAEHSEQPWVIDQGRRVLARLRAAIVPPHSCHLPLVMR